MSSWERRLHRAKCAPSCKCPLPVARGRPWPAESPVSAGPDSSRGLLGPLFPAWGLFSPSPAPASSSTLLSPSWLRKCPVLMTMALWLSASHCLTPERPSFLFSGCFSLSTSPCVCSLFLLSVASPLALSYAHGLSLRLSCVHGLSPHLASVCGPSSHIMAPSFTTLCFVLSSSVAFLSTTFHVCGPSPNLGLCPGLFPGAYGTARKSNT